MSSSLSWKVLSQRCFRHRHIVSLARLPVPCTARIARVIAPIIWRSPAVDEDSGTNELHATQRASAAGRANSPVERQEPANEQVKRRDPQKDLQYQCYPRMCKHNVACPRLLPGVLNVFCSCGWDSFARSDWDACQETALANTALAPTTYQGIKPNECSNMAEQRIRKD